MENMNWRYFSMFCELRIPDIKNLMFSSQEMSFYFSMIKTLCFFFVACGDCHKTYLLIKITYSMC